MRNQILNLVKRNGATSVTVIVETLGLETEYNEVAKQIAYLQMEGYLHYVSGKGYEARK